MATPGPFASGESPFPLDDAEFFWPGVRCDFPFFILTTFRSLVVDVDLLGAILRDALSTVFDGEENNCGATSVPLPRTNCDAPNNAWQPE